MNKKHANNSDNQRHKLKSETNPNSQYKYINIIVIELPNYNNNARVTRKSKKYQVTRVNEIRMAMRSLDSRKK